MVSDCIIDIFDKVKLCCERQRLIGAICGVSPGSCDFEGDGIVVESIAAVPIWFVRLPASDCSLYYLQRCYYETCYFRTPWSVSYSRTYASFMLSTLL